MNQLEEFKELGLSEQMLEAIKSKGFETPSPIQKLTIPVLLTQTNDIIAQAQTGTGKTAAFGIPILERLKPSKATGVKALILVPTRELALQVTEELLSFNHIKKLSIAAIYGGASISEQLRRLDKGIDIVVGTPGRVLDHIHRKTLLLDNIKYMVLDEADEMLNMGFIEDIEEIMSNMSEERRVLLFSATMPQRIVSLSKKYMRDTEILKVESQQMTVDLTNQIYFEVRESDKFDALTRIIDVEADFYGIVFSRTKIGVDDMVSKLLERGYAAEGLHGDVSQAMREKILRKFKKKTVNILVATDVAARGIDVNNLTHVINYSLPQDTESYVHRIGRTGRAGNQGTAITFISSSELRQFGFMKREIKADIKREVLPTPQDVIATKRNKIKEDLQQVIENENYAECSTMAQEILASYEPEIALSGLLRLAFKNELTESHYPEIRSINVDRRGTARLFISIGRLDGYDARKMVDLLKRECDITDNKIDDVKIMDSYSFVTVPFADAEPVIRKLNAMRQGERPIAELAQDSNKGGSERGSERGGERRGSERRGSGERSSRGGGFGDRDRERAPRGDRAEHSDRSERPERKVYSDRKDSFSRPERSDRAPRGDRAERPAPRTTERVERSAERAERLAAEPKVAKAPKAEKAEGGAFKRDENGDWFSIFERKFGAKTGGDFDFTEPKSTKRAAKSDTTSAAPRAKRTRK